MTTVLCQATLGAPTVFTIGNIIVNNASGGLRDLYEYTPLGEFVQRIPFVPPSGGRDLVIDRDGRAQIYKAPTLLAYDAGANSFTSQTYEGWSTVNNGTYGGIAAFGRYVYATDMTTALAGEPKGVVRFDIEGAPTMRFATDVEPIDLNIGRDGLLYTLSKGSASNGGGNRIDVFDPVSMAFIRMVNLPEEHRAIAIDADGEIYTAQRDRLSRVNHFSPDGFLLDRINDPGVGGFADIDIDSRGNLLIASHGGTLLLTTTALDSIFWFPVRDGETNFAAWIEPPSPKPNADFNGDRVIDGADFLAWQRGLGLIAGAPRVAGDANANGNVDYFDLSVWRSQYGRPYGAATSTPEPSAGCLGLVAIGTIALRRRN